ncbi:MAG: hypothetical protein M1819_002450 [Sarea resinae]|nr:MAG: hypothetical protein M1819_002450 [Sarea resinae]
MPPTLVEANRLELEDISRILHLFHHRNKNQHRLAKWWKWFSMLWRSLQKLLVEASRANISGKDMVRFQARVGHLHAVLVPKCYRAFSTLVADNQFSVLGLVLLANLARVNSIVSGLRDEPKPASIHEDLDIGEDVGELISRDGASSPGPQTPVGDIVATEPDTQQLKRKADGQEGDDQAANNGVLESSKKAKHPLKPAKKKRKKHTNPIDDIFSGLI